MLAAAEPVDTTASSQPNVSYVPPHVRPLKNLGRLYEHFPATLIGTWVAQGGFAGDSVVPPEHRLAKFAGRETCPTFNFNGAPQVALSMLGSEKIAERWLVSKNVCHGKMFHDPLAAAVAIDRTVCTFREVEVYRERGEWGSRLATDTHTRIAVAVDRARFLDVLLEA